MDEKCFFEKTAQNARFRFSVLFHPMPVPAQKYRSCVYFRLRANILTLKGEIEMARHSRTYEQYCCVMEKNIMIEETRTPDGGYHLHCAHHVICALTGGCKNDILRGSVEKDCAGK